MRRIFAGFAVTSFLMLGISSAAYAYDPQLPATCDGGNNVPDGSFTGGTISSPGSCTLSESITASSSVTVSSDGPVNVTGSLNAPGVSVQSTGSTVSVGAITSSAFIDVFAKDANNAVFNDITLNGNLSSTLQTIIYGRNITSNVPLTSAAITSSGGGTVNLLALKGGVDVTNDSGDINVVGNVGDTTTASVYMSAGQAIGVGNIKISGTVSTTSASLTRVQLLAGGNISSGAITSPNIQVLANKFGITGTSTFLLGGGGTNGISGAVTAKNTTGGGGYIDVENGYQTGTGNLTVTDGDVIETGTTGNFIGLYAHGGTLVLPGGKITAGGPLSQVALVGKIVNFGDSTNISSDYLTGGSTHSVAILADTINYAGSSVVTANGAGQDSNNPGAVLVQGYTSGTMKVQFVGASGAKISLGADGDHTYTQVYADAISFATGAVTLHSEGTTDHGVYLTNINPTSSSDTLTVPSGSLTLNASGKNGAGGTIGINVGAATINSAKFTLNANGPATGDGAGGTITFNSLSPVDFSKATVTAKGSGTGAGGSFTGSTVQGASGAFFKVNSVIKVDAGSGSDVGIQDGTISLNGVPCGQWKAGTGTGNTSWPQSYWDCANPTSPNPYEKAMAASTSVLPSAFIATLGNKKVPLYIFNTNANFNSYFSAPKPESNVLGVSSPTVPFAVAFESNSPDNSPYLPGTMMHELGHLLDGFTSPRPSSTPAFTSATNTTISVMTGTWPTPPSPSCLDVYGNTQDGMNFCGPQPGFNPWQIFKTNYLGPPNVPSRELFADAFQNCSGFSIGDVVRNTAQQSMYMNGVWNYMNSTFWPTPCPRQQ